MIVVLSVEKNCDFQDLDVWDVQEVLIGDCWVLVVVIFLFNLVFDYFEWW